MRFTTKTEYGLICLTYMARRYHTGNPVITVRELVSGEQYSLPYVEKIFQCLRQNGIVEAHQGKQGGYTLARPPGEIMIKDVIDALEGGSFDVFCESPVREEIVCNHYACCGMRPLWQKTKALLDEFYGSVTLEMLTKEEDESRRVIAAGKGNPHAA